MSVRLIVEISGGVIAGAAAFDAISYWRPQINALIERLTKRVTDPWGSIGFSKALETFLNEAAVLWFVFPLLNKVFPEGTPRNGSDWSWIGIGKIGISWLAALGLFTGATVFGKITEDLEEKQKRLEREVRE